jgi:hypothetical protein
MDEVRQQRGVRVGVPWLLHEQGRDGSIAKPGNRISRSLESPVLNYKVETRVDGFFAARLPNIHFKKVSNTQKNDWHACTHTNKKHGPVHRNNILI